MPILDNFRDAVTKVIPQKKESLPQAGSTGHGVYRGEDLILTKPFIIASSFQIFLSFIAMCCFAGVASFQAKYKVGPSGLSILAVFVSLLLFFFSSFLLVVPVLYDRYDKLRGLARALRVIRVALICNGIGIFLSLILAFVTTISVFTQAGCKNASKDPSAKSAGKDFVNGLPDWCRTKRAGAVFFWLTLIAWGGTAFLVFQEWRTGKAVYRREDPPFSLPTHAPAATDDEDTDPYTRRQQQHNPAGGDDEDDEYASGPFTDSNRYAGYNAAAGRPSMDAYGAFSDPSPNGYGRGQGQVQGQYNDPEVSRTMQYADPYAQVRANIHTGGGPPGVQPPQYDNTY